MWSIIVSAAIIPLFIAVCDPLIFGMFNVPASQPTNNAPGINILGRLWKPPSISALAPNDILLPPSNIDLIAGWVLNFWNSSNGERWGFL